MATRRDGAPVSVPRDAAAQREATLAAVEGVEGVSAAMTPAAVKRTLPAAMEAVLAPAPFVDAMAPAMMAATVTPAMAAASALRQGSSRGGKRGCDHEQDGCGERAELGHAPPPRSITSAVTRAVHHTRFALCFTASGKRCVGRA